MELSAFLPKFDELGINVVTITYDTPAEALKFHRRNQLGYPILHDVDAKIVKAFGILNEKYKPGDFAYGIPHPGIFLVDRDGLIYGKFSEESYKDRPAIEMVLESARQMAAEISKP